MSGAFVYFVGAPALARCKIGCSQGPEERVKTLMAWSPCDLELWATLPGRFELEKRFHSRFVHLHERGEWFRINDELMATVAAIRDGTFRVDALPPAKALPRYRRPAAPSLNVARGLVAAVTRMGYRGIKPDPDTAEAVKVVGQHAFDAPPDDVIATLRRFVDANKGKLARKAPSRHVATLQTGRG